MEITQERLRNLFVYDPLAGSLVWRARPLSDFPTKRSRSTWIARFAGKVAGSVDDKGYRVVVIDNRKHREHRLIWFYFYGEWPEEVDHEFGDTADNRIERLRDVSHAENSRNTKRRADNKSGEMGVHWCAFTRKWRVRIAVNGQHIHIGRFSSFDEAVAARKSASTQYGFHPNHGRAGHVEA